MRPIEHRHQVELRASVTEDTLHGIAVPWREFSHPIRDGGTRLFRERWAPGAARWDERTTLTLLHTEAGGLPLARIGAGTLELESIERGLSFEAQLPGSPFGQNVLRALQRGDLDGSVSVAFRPLRQRWDRTVATPLRTIESAHIVHIALVPAGAFAGAVSSLSRSMA